jgi:hypothetical protein
MYWQSAQKECALQGLCKSGIYSAACTNDLHFHKEIKNFTSHEEVFRIFH